MLINNINYFNIKYNILKEVFFIFKKIYYNSSLKKMMVHASCFVCSWMKNKRSIFWIFYLFVSQIYIELILNSNYSLDVSYDPIRTKYLNNDTSLKVISPLSQIFVLYKDHSDIFNRLLGCEKEENHG